MLREKGVGHACGTGIHEGAPPMRTPGPASTTAMSKEGLRPVGGGEARMTGREPKGFAGGFRGKKFV